jgi:hypothetical protein
MIGLLLAAIFFGQGQEARTRIPAITGVVRDNAGRPLPGLRVAAMAVTEAGTAEALVSFSLTDETGRYRLELIAGRYYIVAGRLAQKLFEELVRVHPDTPESAEAKRKLAEIQEKSGRKNP